MITKLNEVVYSVNQNGNKQAEAAEEIFVRRIFYKKRQPHGKQNKYKGINARD